MKQIFFCTGNFLRSLLRVFFAFLNGGEHCAVCGKQTFTVPLCSECLKKYFNVQSALKLKRCCVCGKELNGLKEKCFECRENQVIKSADLVIPLFSYRLWNRELMFLWKGMEKRGLSKVFAELVFEALQVLGIKYIVPVPPRPGKIKEKGWDQIQELCNFLCFKYGIKKLELLQRNSTEQQKKLSRKNRLNTIQSAYSLKSGKFLERSLLKLNSAWPEQVCIIDDVCTTGATVECCAALLKALGIKKVTAVTLFTVD